MKLKTIIVIVIDDSDADPLCPRVVPESAKVCEPVLGFGTALEAPDRLQPSHHGVDAILGVALAGQLVFVVATAPQDDLASPSGADAR